MSGLGILSALIALSIVVARLRWLYIRDQRRGDTADFIEIGGLHTQPDTDNGARNHGF